MPFDFAKIADTLEKASPTLSHRLSMTILGLVSPFNSHLKARLMTWTKNSSEIMMTCHRNVKNHVGTIHAGALFTLGETCAGLIIVKNFSFKDYRPLMTEISVQFSKQARTQAVGRADVTKATLEKIKKGLQAGKPQLLPMKTVIQDENGEEVAVVKTKWQIKPWKQVRKK